MNAELSQKETLLYRTLLALVLIGLAAAVRIAPHPWNFTPVGAMALFSGAVLKDRRLAFAFPLLALFAGDLFVGFYKPTVMLIVYASFLINVAIGLWLRDRRTVARISLATLLGAIRFDTYHNSGALCSGGGVARISELDLRVGYQHRLDGPPNNLDAAA